MHVVWKQIGVGGGRQYFINFIISYFYFLQFGQLNVFLSENLFSLKSFRTQNKVVAYLQKYLDVFCLHKKLMKT